MCYKSYKLRYALDITIQQSMIYLSVQDIMTFCKCIANVSRIGAKFSLKESAKSTPLQLDMLDQPTVLDCNSQYLPAKTNEYNKIVSDLLIHHGCIQIYTLHTTLLSSIWCTHCILTSLLVTFGHWLACKQQHIYWRSVSNIGCFLNIYPKSMVEHLSLL